MLGHVLRMNKNSQARMAMKLFFEKRSNNIFLGRKRATIVTTINNDIQKTTSFDINELKTECSLHNIGVKARERKKWSRIVKMVVDMAFSEAST